MLGTRYGPVGTDFANSSDPDFLWFSEPDDNFLWFYT